MKNIPGKPPLIQLKFSLFKAKSLIAFCAANGEQKWQEKLLDENFQSPSTEYFEDGITFTNQIVSEISKADVFQ